MLKYSAFLSSSIFFACLITVALPSTCFALGGSGTLENPYVIASKADFDVFSNPANAATYWASGVYTKLVCDIDLAGTYTTAVIAPDTDNTNAQTFDGVTFAGVLNGNDYTISNLTIDSAGVKNSYLGLFGQIAAEGQVMNLGVENINITSDGEGEATYYIGGLCGNNLGVLTHCYTTGSVTGSYTGYVGGLIGQNTEGLVSSCYSSVNVSAGDGSGFIGGMAGVNVHGSITDCYAGGSVAGTYNTDWLGGLVGISTVVTSGKLSSVSNCYATGSVANGNSSSNVGGLAGENSGTGSSVANCFWDIDTGGPDNGIGTPKTTVQMQTDDTFINAGWDFVDETDNGTEDYWRKPYQIGYPILHWQHDIPGDFTGSYGVNLEDFAVFARDWMSPSNGLLPEQTAKFTGCCMQNYFGRSVGIDGDIAIIGTSYQDAAHALHNGSARLFDLTTKTQIALITAGPDVSSSDRFGHSVAIEGHLAIVGAVGINDFSGAVYLFDAATGTLLDKFTANDANANDFFGCSLAINNNIMIVGANGDDDGGSRSGSAYLFDITTGDQIAKLTASDPAVNDEFGDSVAIDGNTTIIGAPWDDDDGDYSGSAYLFDVTTGTQIAKLTASDAAAEDSFGYSVGMDGSIAIVGAPNNDDNGSNSGSAYLFDVTTGTQIAKITASDAAAEDHFGGSVGISGNVAIVGATGDDDGSDNSGSVYLFDVTTGVQLAKLNASDPANGDSFGGAVDISGNSVVVGASSKRSGYIGVGAAYIFENDGITYSETNLNERGSIDIEDLVIFCGNWLEGTP